LEGKFKEEHKQKMYFEGLYKEEREKNLDLIKQIKVGLTIITKNQWIEQSLL
jgi:hypothetical protein